MTLKSWQRRLALGCMALAVACSQPEPDRPRSILLISLDTLRPDHLGAYGYDRPTSPRLDALAAQGVLFENALSPAPWTLPSHASMLTGLYPSHHGLTEVDTSLPSHVRTLAVHLGLAGFATAALVNSKYLTDWYGLDRGYDTHFYLPELVSSREPTRTITHRAVAWLKENRARRNFLFLHYYDAHSDYNSHPEFERRFARPYTGEIDGSTRQLEAVRDGEQAISAEDAEHLVDLYDAGIRQLDQEMTRLFRLLEAQGLLDDTLVVVTSDHGEEFLEHGGVLHGRTQFDELLRVPLFMRGPGLPAGRRVHEAVSLVDLLPTLLSLADVPLDSPVDGVDLSPLWRGGKLAPQRVLFGEADHNRSGHSVTRSARRGSYKLHYDLETQERVFYDLESDPDERSPITAGSAPTLAELSGRLDAFMRTAIAPLPTKTLTHDEVEHLRSLGYVVDSVD